MRLKIRNIIFAAAAVLLVVCWIFGRYASGRPPAAGVSAMDGYVSRYNPGHISSGEALALVKAGGAAMLDVRSKAGYDERHVSGALNVPLEALAGYAARNLPDKGRVIICYCFCGDMGGDALVAYKRLTGLGYTRVYYTDPGDEWAYEGASAAPAAAGCETVTGQEAKAIYDANPGAVLLDVRSRAEYDAGHIDGSALIPVDELASRLSELPDKNAAVIVYCRSGARSLTACGILSAAGYTRVYNMQKVDNWPLPLVRK